MRSTMIRASHPFHADPRFLLEPFEPAYLDLHRADALAERVTAGLRELEDCCMPAELPCEPHGEPDAGLSHWPLCSCRQRSSPTSARRIAFAAGMVQGRSSSACATCAAFSARTGTSASSPSAPSAHRRSSPN